MRCSKCGAQNDDINDSCVNCGEPLAYARPQGGDVFSRIVPYKNSRALIAYYLAVFSLIPFVGILLGIAAFVLGLLGLRFAKEHPDSGGKVHAWIGILLGGLFGFGYLILALLLVQSAVTGQ